MTQPGNVFVLRFVGNNVQVQPFEYEMFVLGHDAVELGNYLIYILRGYKAEILLFTVSLKQMMTTVQRHTFSKRKIHPWNPASLTDSFKKFVFFGENQFIFQSSGWSTQNVGCDFLSFGHGGCCSLKGVAKCHISLWSNEVWLCLMEPQQNMLYPIWKCLTYWWAQSLYYPILLMFVATHYDIMMITIFPIFFSSSYFTGPYKDAQNVMWLQAFNERCWVLQHNNDATPEEIFGSLLPQSEAKQMIVRETNRYAE